MRFEKEVRDQYLTYSTLGNRVAAKLSLYAKHPFLPDLRDLLDTDKSNTEPLGILEIPVSKIIGIASICGKCSYTADFLPVDPPASPFAKTWCSIYMDYLNEKEIAPITCYEYLGQFYVIDGKKRVSIMKCNHARVIKANVIRILPAETNSVEATEYYSFLESYEKTGLYEICLCSKYTFEDLQKAMGHDKDYVWTKHDRHSMLFTLISVEYGLKMSKLNKLTLNPIDAFMFLVENYSYQEAIRMSSLQMAKCFNANKEKLLALFAPEQNNVRKIA